MDKFYFTGFLGTAYEQLLSDVNEYPNVTILDEITTNFSTSLNEKIHRWWYQWLVPRHEISCGNVWNKNYPIYNLDFSDDDNHYIIFGNSALVKAYNLSFFKALKKRGKNIKLILYIVDPMTGYGCNRVKYVKDAFDLIVSHVEQDCEQYGFDYFPLMYSKVNVLRNNGISDIYFCGGNGVSIVEKDGKREYGRGGRVEKLYDLWENSKQKDVEWNCYINGVNQNDIRTDVNFKYNQPISNTENIANVMGTNCILEIMHDGFNAITTRYMEAIAYNKKLLSNNKNLVSMKYYNPDYMHVFENEDEIDWDWVKRKDEVDYNYDEDCSPKKFLGFVKEKIG